LQGLPKNIDRKTRKSRKTAKRTSSNGSVTEPVKQRKQQTWGNQIVKQLQEATAFDHKSIGPTVFRRKICQILRASLQNSVAHCAAKSSKFRGSPYGLISMTDNCAETSEIEGWHYTKG